MDKYNRKAVRPPCSGSAHVMPVPRGMSPEDAWAEISTLGHLAESGRPIDTWACVECPGDDRCECRTHWRSRTYRHWHNDELVFATVLGKPLPKMLLPIVDRLFPQPG